MISDLLLRVSLMCLVILLLIFILKKFNQPYLIAYILAGVLMGPDVAGIFNEVEDAASIGELGILLLMFFLGMELEIPDRRSLLVKPVIAQLMRMLMSIGLVALAGYLLGWPLMTVILIATLFIFNSTAVVSEYLRKNGELHSNLGRMTLNILLLQDVLLAPVLTLFPLLGGGPISVTKMVASLGGCVLIFLLLRSIRNRDFFQPRIQSLIGSDHELQVFAGGFLCLGFGLLAELAGLSGSIGSFLAGMMIGRLDAFRWLERTLSPFKVFFVALFFVSVGLRLDLAYISANKALILTGTLVLFLVNSVLSAFVLRLLRYGWRESFYGGALLSQAGEFGILVCSMAYKTNIIEQGLFKTGIAITALSLLFSTIWIGLLRKTVVAHKLGTRSSNNRFPEKSRGSL